MQRPDYSFWLLLIAFLLLGCDNSDAVGGCDPERKCHSSELPCAVLNWPGSAIGGHHPHRAWICDPETIAVSVGNADVLNIECSALLLTRTSCAEEAWADEPSTVQWTVDLGTGLADEVSGSLLVGEDTVAFQFENYGMQDAEVLSADVSRGEIQGEDASLYYRLRLPDGYLRPDLE